MKENFIVNSIIAHRGIFDNKKIPENSIKAFKDALNKNYVIEFDVHLTKDKKIVVFHDMDLDRMTKKTGPIKELTLSELDFYNCNKDYMIDRLEDSFERIK